MEENKDIEVVANPENVPEAVTETLDAEPVMELGENDYTVQPDNQGEGGNEPEKPKKKHKGLKIALIAVGSLVAVFAIVIAIAYFTQKDYLLNAWAMLTKNDTEYFKYVVDRNLDKIQEKQDKYKEETKDWKFPESFGVNGKLEVSLAEELGKLIDSDFAGIDNAGIKYEIVVNKDESIGGLVSASYKSEELLSVGGAYTIPDKKLFVAIPSYKPQSIDLSGLLEMFSDKIDELEGTLDKIDSEKIQQAITEYEEESERGIIGRLLYFVYDQVIEAELEKKVEVSVNGLEKKVNVLKCSIPKEKIAEILGQYVDEFGRLAKAILPAFNGDSRDSDKVNEIADSVKNTIKNIFENTSISLEGSVYVDAKGDIIGGQFQLSVNETKIVLDILKLPDEEDKNVTDTAAELSVGGMKVLNFMNKSEEKDGKKVFNAVIQPSSLISTLVLGGKNYVIEASGSCNKITDDPFETDFSLSVKEGNTEYAKLVFTNSLAAGKKDLPIDISAGNTINYMDLADSGYINLKDIFSLLLNTLDKIGDNNLNNFVNGILKKFNLNFDLGFLKNLLGSSLENSFIINAIADKFGIDKSIIEKALESPIMDKIKDGLYDSGLSLDLDTLKIMVDSPEVLNVFDELLARELKKKLGIEEEYQYEKLTEDPKMQDSKYIFSWDILDQGTVNLDNVNFVVYDHFERPVLPEVDIEAEKEKFIAQYAGQTFEYSCEAGAVITMGDKIVFDAVVLFLGIPMYDYSFPGNTATVGEYEFGAGVDDQFIGKMVGDSIDISLTLDSRFGSHAGETHTFRVTIRDIRRNMEPEWSERFIVGALGYESINACEDQLYAEAYKNLPEADPAPTAEDIRNALFAEFIKNYDTSAYNEDTKALFNEYMSKLNEAKGTDEDIDYLLAEYGIVASLANEKGWLLYESDIPSEYDKLAAEMGYSSGSQLEERDELIYGKRYLIDRTFINKAANLIYAKANIIWD